MSKKNNKLQVPAGSKNPAGAPATNIGGLQPHFEREKSSENVEISTLEESKTLDLFKLYNKAKNEDFINGLKRYSKAPRSEYKSVKYDDLNLDNGYKIDWLAFTYNERIGLDVILNELNYTFDEFEEVNGRYFYNSGYTIGNYVNIYLNSSSKEVHKNSSPTINFVFTGQGCTDLWNRAGKTRENFLNILSRLKKYDVKITRFDLAFDDFSGVFDFDMIENKLNAGEFRSSKRSFNIVRSSDVNKNKLGRTIYIGSSRSSSQKGNFYLRFYDKKAQYEEKHQILPDEVLNSGIWQRAEISFTKQKANQVFYNLLDENLGHDEDYIFKTNMRNLVEFLEPTIRQKTAKTQHRERWEVCTWWEEFLSFDEKYTFVSAERDVNLGNLLNWLKISVIPSLKLLEVLGEIKGFDIYKILQDFSFNSDDFSKKQLRLLHDSLLSDTDDINKYINEFFGVE